MPTGWSITAGSGTNSITVTAGSTGQNGNITVTATNSCGTSTAQTLPVTVSPGPPATPGAITGNANQCINRTNLTYSISAVPNATSYNWSLPTGWTITSGAGTANITVSTNGSAVSGDISVTATNSCGTSSAQIFPVTIYTALPPDAGIITGPNAICPAISGLVYSIASVANATNYTWTVPSGWTITSGQGTTSITASAGAGSATGNQNVMVTASNPCGSSITSIANVSVGSFAFVDAGPDQIVCAGTTQITLAGSIGGVVTGNNQWDWSSSVPGGTGFSNGGNNLTGTYGIPPAIQNGGTVTITITSTIDPAGACLPVSDNMVVTILPAPTASISVTGTNPICTGSTSVITFTASPNTTVTYTITGNPTPQTINVGASGTATLTTAALTTNTIYTLTTVAYNSTPACSRTITGSATVTVNANPVVNAGADQTVCASNPNVTLNGSITGSITTGTWTTAGTGTFNNANALNAVYTPSAAEISAGTVTLTLTSGDPPGPCNPVSDQMIITINPAATANANVDQTVCASSPNVTLAGSVGGSATTGTWSGGAGTFAPNNTTLGATYTPTAAEITAGTVILTLTTNDPAGPCGTATDQMTITINPSATANANVDQTVCAQSPNVTLAGSIGGGATSGTWSGGAGKLCTKQYNS